MSYTPGKRPSPPALPLHHTQDMFGEDIYGRTMGIVFPGYGEIFGFVFTDPIHGHLRRDYLVVSAENNPMRGCFITKCDLGFYAAAVHRRIEQNGRNTCMRRQAIGKPSAHGRTGKQLDVAADHLLQNLCEQFSPRIVHGRCIHPIKRLMQPFRFSGNRCRFKPVEKGNVQVVFHLQ